MSIFAHYLQFLVSHIQNDCFMKKIFSKIALVTLLLVLCGSSAFAQQSKYTKKGNKALAQNDEEKAAHYFYCGAMFDQSKTAFDTLEAMADRGSQDANMLMGAFYQQGVMVEKDLAKAISLYQKAEKFNLKYLIKALENELNNAYGNDPDSLDRNTIYTLTEKAPEFPGGMEAMMATLSRNTIYPEYARNLKLAGTVLVKFVVEKDGRMDGFTIVVPLHPILDNETIRSLSTLPKWKPGLLNGKPVRCYYQIPMTFRM